MGSQLWVQEPITQWAIALLSYHLHLREFNCIPSAAQAALCYHIQIKPILNNSGVKALR